MAIQKTNENTQAIYNVCQGTLLNGAKKFKYYNFVYYIGGDNKGFSQVNVNVLNNCIYYLTLKYVSYDTNLSFKISINNIDDNKVYYADFFPEWSITSPLTVTIPISLNSGDNIIKFYGNENNKAPYLGEFSLNLPIVTNDLSKGILENTAYVDSNTNFVNAVGGPKDGAVTVTIKTETKGLYNLVLNYICQNNSRYLKINVNGVEDEKNYILFSTMVGTISNVKKFTIPVNLNAGNNTIKFHGDGINYAPNLGSILIDFINSSATSLFATSKGYKVSSGTLGNGAAIDKTNNMVINLGGSKDGYSIVKVIVDTLGDYLIKLNYINNNKSFKIDINGIETETVYKITATDAKSGILSKTISLVCGNNTLKFHGNEINDAPNLGDFTLELIKDNSSTAFTGDVLNGASILSKGIITGIGGYDDGSYTMKYTASDFGWYDIYLSVDTSKGSILALDINSDKDLMYEFYDATKTDVVIVHVITVILKKGENNITFHGVYNFDTSPDILNIEIKLSNIIKGSIYNFIDGLLEQGAVGDLSKNFVSGLGGINNGAVTINVNINRQTLYDFNITYLGKNVKSPLKIDIITNKNITTSTLCILPAKNSNNDFELEEFKITLPLNKGINNIKFYGNEIDLVPNLSYVRISEALVGSSEVFSKTYELATEATLLRSAVISKDVPNFIEGIGGSRAGIVKLPISVPISAEYTIEIKYLKKNDSEQFSIQLEFNNNIYNPPKTNSLKKEDAKIITITTFLSKESMMIVSGVQNNNAPLLGNITITETKLSSSKQYKITSIKFNKEAQSDIKDFIIVSGGFYGEVVLNINTNKIFFVDLSFKYLCASNKRTLKLNINDDRDIIYNLPLTEDWELINAQTFTIPLQLKDGNNTIKFQGDGYNFTPIIIGKFNLEQNNRMSITAYDTATGISYNGAKINKYGLITNIGGPKKGEIEVKVIVPIEGRYDLILEYKPTQENKLQIIVNRTTTYDVAVPLLFHWSSVDLPTTKVLIYLKKGSNSITFTCLDTKYYAPFLGKFTLSGGNGHYSFTKILPKGGYDLTKGKLENGADVFGEFVDYLGFSNKASVSITINVSSKGNYIMFISYVALEDSYLMFDINGEENGYILFFEKTNCYIDEDEIKIILKEGDNLIKFYGVENNSAPRLSTIFIKKFN